MTWRGWVGARRAIVRLTSARAADHIDEAHPSPSSGPLPGPVPLREAADFRAPGSLKLKLLRLKCLIK